MQEKSIDKNIFLWFNAIINCFKCILCLNNLMILILSYHLVSKENTIMKHLFLAFIATFALLNTINATAQEAETTHSREIAPITNAELLYGDVLDDPVKWAEENYELLDKKAKEIEELRQSKEEAIENVKDAEDDFKPKKSFLSLYNSTKPDMHQLTRNQAKKFDLLMDAKEFLSDKVIKSLGYNPEDVNTPERSAFLYYHSCVKNKIKQEQKRTLKKLERKSDNVDDKLKEAEAEFAEMNATFIENMAKVNNRIYQTVLSPTKPKDEEDKSRKISWKRR